MEQPEQSSTSKPTDITPSALHDTPIPSQKSYVNDQIFTFPTIQVDGSIANLASCEDTISMTRNRVHQQTSSSLEDSTYEVLGDSALLSDAETDDGNTASLTSQSVDGRTPDDLSSIADTEDEHYDNVSRQEAVDEVQPHTDLEESVYPSSDEDEEDFEANKVPAVPRQAERGVEESELTARPGSPDIDVDMSPSLQHLGGRPLTDSELFDHHNLPQPRALTVQDLKKLPKLIYQESCDMTSELLLGLKHWSKTMQLTYQANKDSVDYYGGILLRSLLGLTIAWLLSNISLTVNYKSASPPVAVTPEIPTLAQSLVKSVPSAVQSVAEVVAPSAAAPQIKVPIPDSPSLTSTSDIGSPMQSLAVNESADFLAHVLGDNHFILTPPKQFARSKKQPELFVNVIRDGETLPATVNKYDGVYAVEIDRDQAWGVMDVMLYTKSKPKIKQQFQLNFGNPWLKLNVWQASAEKLSRSLRDEWSTVNDFVAQAMKSARKEFKDLHTRASTDANTRATAVTKDVSRILAAQSKALSSHLASLQHVFVKDMSNGASKVTKEISKLYSTISSLNPKNVVREVQEFHAQVAARAQTNAANIVKKLQNAQEQRKVRKASRVVEQRRAKSERGGKKSLKEMAADKKACRVAKKQERQARRNDRKASFGRR